MTARKLLAAAAAALLLAGCGLAGTTPVPSESPTRPIPAPATPLPDSGTAPSPETVEARVRAVLDLADSEVMNAVSISPWGVQVQVQRNGRLYEYREVDTAPQGMADDGAGRPFTLDDVDLPAVMTETLAIDDSCTEPYWRITSVAYDLRMIRLSCDEGALYTFWDDRTLVDVSMATVADAEATAARLPAGAPTMAYDIIASSQGQVGDQLQVGYVDDELGTVEVELSNRDGGSIDATVLSAQPHIPFPLAEVPMAAIVNCGTKQMADAGISSWFVHIRYSPLHDQVVMKWDVENSWKSIGPLTDLDCNPLE